MEGFSWRKAMIGMVALCVLTALPIAADSTDVNENAALGGSGTACNGSNCGLEVLHDATTGAFVQDNTPDNETTYRAEFLIDPNSLGAGGASFRIPIFNVVGPNPNPGVGNCGASTFKQAASVVLIHTGGGNYSLQILGNGNQCGAASGLPRRISIADAPSKICMEIVMNNGSNGSFAVANVGTGDPCPTSGDAAYSQRTIFNPNARADFVRLGTLMPNGTGASSPGSLYFDEFASFRTTAP